MEITKMENGGYVLEVTPKQVDTAINDCPWRHPDTCKACPNRGCGLNKKGVK